MFSWIFVKTELLIVNKMCIIERCWQNWSFDMINLQCSIYFNSYWKLKASNLKKDPICLITVIYKIGTQIFFELLKLENFLKMKSSLIQISKDWFEERLTNYVWSWWMIGDDMQKIHPRYSTPDLLYTTVFIWYFILHSLSSTSSSVVRTHHLL